MNSYCTLFDSYYLTRGLTMYNSLAKYEKDFCLYIFAFDDLAYEILDKLALPHTVIIPMRDFENERLLAIKQNRSRGEYCWTCSSFSVLYVLQHYEVSEVTYLDADLYFYGSPEILLDEFHNSGKSVMITRHRYTPEYDQSATSGIYCVQFMTFKNDDDGLRVLNWWADRCEKWCYARFEDGKFGDQKYLDDWLTRFDCVHELQHLGGGVAPWNVQQYKVANGPKVDGVPVVFYHFHGLKWLTDSDFNVSDYRLQDEVKQILYRPYLLALKDSLLQIRLSWQADFDLGIIGPENTGLKNSIKQKIKKILGRPSDNKMSVL